GAGRPINVLDVLLHTMAVSGLSRLRTEFDRLLVVPSLTHHPVQVHPVFAPARLWPVPFSAASHTVLIGFSGSYPPTCCTPNPRSTPIAHRVRRKHQRLPPSITVLQKGRSTKRTTRELPEQNPCDSLSKCSDGPRVMPRHAHRPN